MATLAGSSVRDSRRRAAYSQKVFDLVKPIAKASIELHHVRLSADQRQEERTSEPGRRASRLPREECPARPAPGSGGRGFSPRTSFGQMKRSVRISGFARPCLLARALLSVGCRDALGPEKMVTTTVNGTVTQAGKPLSRGWIEFIPVDGTVGRMRSARIQKDGTFHATKVAGGLQLDPPGQRRYR